MEYYTGEDYPYLVAYLNRKNTWTLSDVSEEYGTNLKNKSKHHKHDKLFRKILNDEEEIVKLINEELDPEEKIKVGDIEKYETKYITKLYEERESDIVYKLKDKEVFFLIEEQTKVDMKMPERITEYTVAIMNSKRGLKDKPTATVIPIVIYAGKARWTAKKDLIETQEEFRHYRGSSLFFKYNLVDIRSVEEAIRRGTAIARMSVIEKLNTTEEIMETIDKFADNLESEKEIKEFTEEVEYILEDKLEEEKLEKVKEIILSKRKGDDIMSHVHEVLRRDAERARREAIQEGRKEGRKEGIQEGMQEGIQKGRKEGAKESLMAVAKKMLMEKVDVEFISKITGLKKEEFAK